MGYKLAGCSVDVANDIDPQMQWHYVTNLHPPEYVLGGVRDLLTRDFGEVDILDGSPPCSTFSLSGLRERSWGKKKHFREGQTEQVLDDLFFDFLDVAEHIRPRVVIAENVKGMLGGNARGYLRAIVDRLRRIGYAPVVHLLNAAHFEVPQRRERVFICAHRDDVAVRSSELEFETSPRVITVREALSDLVMTDEEVEETAPSPGDRLWWPRTAQGALYSAATKSWTGKDKLWNYIRLHPDRPANTLTACFDKLKHPTEMRSLSLREIKRLGAFPDDYVAQTPQLGKYLIGMSVPPLLMKAVASAVRRAWIS